jgi:hypothetical protein
MTAILFYCVTIDFYNLHQRIHSNFEVFCSYCMHSEKILKLHYDAFHVYVQGIFSMLCTVLKDAKD